MNMKMNVSNTIFIPSELAFGVFPFGFVFLISLPPLSFTAKRKRLFIPHLYTPLTICSRTEDTEQERSKPLKLVLSIHFNFDMCAMTSQCENNRLKSQLLGENVQPSRS